jgi:hypothetical protein
MSLDRGNSNEMIKSLITNFNGYIKDMGNRLKINSFFAEFDEKARNDLMKLIKYSNMRYKGVKSGNELKTVIAKQRQQYLQMGAKILADEFYLTDEINNEQKKLRKFDNNLKNNEINVLRKHIKDSTKAMSKEEELLREKLEEKLERKKKLKEAKLNLSRLDRIHIGKFTSANSHQSLKASSDTRGRKMSVNNTAPSVKERLNSNEKKMDPKAFCI